MPARSAYAIGMQTSAPLVRTDTLSHLDSATGNESAVISRWVLERGADYARAQTRI